MNKFLLLIVAACWGTLSAKSTKRSLDGQIVHLEHLSEASVKKDTTQTLDETMRINLRSEDGQLIEFNLVKNVKLTRPIPMEVDDAEDVYIDDLLLDEKEETFLADDNENCRRCAKDDTPYEFQRKFHERHMFYQDQRRHAVVGLTDHGHKITMRASFLHAGQLYQVEPLDKHPTAHRVTRDELPTQGFDFVHARDTPPVDIDLKPPDNTTDESHNRKRAAGPDDFKHPDAYSVELFLVTDQSFYEKVMKNLPPPQRITAAMEALYFRLCFILNGMDLAFSKITQFKIDIWAKKIYVSRNVNTSPWTEKNKVTLSNGQVAVHQQACLDDVGIWAHDKGFKWYQYDHYMMFTAYDIGKVDAETGEWDSGAVGLVYSSNVCVPKMAMSIIEDTGLKTYLISCHELGHSLGAPHDGSGVDDEGNPDCLMDSMHIMTPFIAVPDADKLDNVATFSACSEKYMADNIYGRNKYNSPKSCLFNAQCRNVAPNIDWSSSIIDMPGQKFSLDQQCALGNSRNGFDKFASGAYGETDFPEICYNLKCTNGTHWLTKIAGAAAGTFCNSEETKWCVLSKCVPTSDVPPVQGGLDYPISDPDFQCGARPSRKSNCKDYRGQITLNGQIMTCAEIVEAVGPMICGDIGGAGGLCCRSCLKRYFIPV